MKPSKRNLPNQKRREEEARHGARGAGKYALKVKAEQRRLDGRPEDKR